MGCSCKVASDNNRAAAFRAASRLETLGSPDSGVHAVFAVVRIAQTSQAQYHSDCFRQSAKASTINPPSLARQLEIYETCEDRRNQNDGQRVI